MPLQIWQPEGPLSKPELRNLSSPPSSPAQGNMIQHLDELEELSRATEAITAPERPSRTQDTASSINMHISQSSVRTSANVHVSMSRLQRTSQNNAPARQRWFPQEIANTFTRRNRGPNGRQNHASSLESAEAAVRRPDTPDPWRHGTAEAARHLRPASSPHPLTLLSVTEDEETAILGLAELSRQPRVWEQQIPSHMEGQSAIENIRDTAWEVNDMLEEQEEFLTQEERLTDEELCRLRVEDLTG